MFYKTAIALSAALLVTTSVSAQTAGSTVVSAGWLHLAPQSSSDPLRVTSPASVSGVRAGTGSSVSNADTVGLLVNHFITDNITAELVVGVPPKHDINGTGVYDSYGKLGSVKQWSPAIVVKYYFGDANTRFRPYIGAGVNYTWFSDAEITNSQFAAQRFFTTTDKISAKAKASWNPVITAGASYAINDRWYAGAFVSYVPLKTTATITATGTPVGTIVSEADIKVRPIVTSLHVGYRF